MDKSSKNTSSNLTQINQLDQQSKLKEYKNIKKKRYTFLKSDKGYQIRVLKDINHCLISLGFSIENLYFLFLKYQYKSLDHALMFISKNGNFYNHDFADISESITETKNINYNDMNISPEKAKKDNSASHSLNQSILTQKSFKSKYRNYCLICNDKKHFHLNVLKSNEDEESFKNMNNNDNNQLIRELEVNFDQGNAHLQEFISKKQIQDRHVTFQHLKDMQYDTNKQVLIYLQQAFTKELPKDNFCKICYTKVGNTEYCHCENRVCKECLQEYFYDSLRKETDDDIMCPFKCGYFINDYLKKEFLEMINTQSIPNIKRHYEDENKMKEFMTENNNFHNDSGEIPCVHPDCNEKIWYNEFVSKFISCELGHKFCARCKNPWHFSLECTNYLMNKEFLQSDIIRMCPNCGWLVIRSENSYSMKCICCCYNFCFFCLEQVEGNHFSLFNLKSCGWKKHQKQNEHENKGIYKIKELKEITGCCFRLFVISIYLIMQIIYISFYSLFGCSYEIIIMYNEYLATEDAKLKEKEEAQQSVEDFMEYGKLRDKFGMIGNIVGNIYDNVQDTIKRSKIFYILICIILLVFGLLCQPVYLIFKILELVFDVYKFYRMKDIDHRD